MRRHSSQETGKLHKCKENLRYSKMQGKYTNTLEDISKEWQKHRQRYGYVEGVIREKLNHYQ